MKLSISNIAWSADADAAMYSALRKHGFSGLEIAPTRIFPKAPYAMREQAEAWSRQLMDSFSLSVSSMQSIWYGRTEQLFADERQRDVLLEYTKAAIRFARWVGCPNLVFGSPKNRCTFRCADYETGIAFFAELAAYAQAHDTVIGLEANPIIYGTNYINTTDEALALVRQLDADGLRLNLDVGTMIANQESAETIVGSVKWISHVHISEPFLQCIQKRPLHRELLHILANEGYQGYISIEMGRQEQTETILAVMDYLREIVMQEMGE